MVTRFAGSTNSTRFNLCAGLLALFVVAASTATETKQAAPQPPTFKSGVENVEVDVVVTNPQGQFVRDLTKKDFHVSEDGKPQAVNAFALVDIPIEKYDRRRSRLSPRRSALRVDLRGPRFEPYAKP
jgi:hypothetical protein